MDSFPVCTQCGFTFAEYRARALLGCPHCYATFGTGLEADILWLHPHGTLEDAPAPVPSETVAGWRERLGDALRGEKYEEAARLRRLIEGEGPERFSDG